jgi:hypothetical protein
MTHLRHRRPKNILMHNGAVTLKCGSHDPQPQGFLSYGSDLEDIVRPIAGKVTGPHPK